jgi:hypothetical protein
VTIALTNFHINKHPLRNQREAEDHEDEEEENVVDISNLRLGQGSSDWISSFIFSLFESQINRREIREYTDSCFDVPVINQSLLP